jgi:hypothetical protein
MRRTHTAHINTLQKPVLPKMSATCLDGTRDQDVIVAEVLFLLKVRLRHVHTKKECDR